MLFSLLGLPYAWSARRRHWQRGTGSDNGNGNAPDRKQRIGVSSDSDPNQPHYEFQGPPGAIVLLVSLPLVIAGLYFGCNGDRCVSLNPLSDEFLGGLTLDTLLTTPLTFVDAQRFFFTYLWSVDTWLIYLCWFFGHVLLYFILPGRVVEGVTLDAAGTKLKYPLNGLLSMFVSMSVVIGLAYFGVISPTLAYDKFTQLAFTAYSFSLLLSIYLYASSLYSSRAGGKYLTAETQLAPHGATGNVIYDFFIGRTLNPRIGSLDLKYFCELRPGLIGWALINLSMAAKQYELHGTITYSMVLVNLFQAYYVWDALNSESAILTTMDITTDGFGWMLAFGDLAWVPFTYSTQTRFLVDYPVNLSIWGMLLVVGVKALGFKIFRGSNSEKNDFRRDPNASHVQHLKFIRTRTGSKLLISGWWGYSRHMNYFGDLLMGLSWCMPCGVTSIIPYFYFFYFAGLLAHRERRDDEKCRNKYKEDWERYCKIVPYRIVPFIY